MAVHDLGYRGWSGELAPAGARTLAIARVGITHAWQSRWLRRLVFFTWLPACWFALGFFLWEQSLLYPEMRQGMAVFLRGAPEWLTLARRHSGCLPLVDEVARRDPRR